VSLEFVSSDSLLVQIPEINVVVMACGEQLTGIAVETQGGDGVVMSLECTIQSWVVGLGICHFLLNFIFSLCYAVG
jgi:hypothetical protein